MQSPADGYTLLLVGARTPSTRRSMKSSVQFPPRHRAGRRASSAIANLMVVHPSFPAKTVAEFIAYAKANPGKVSFASAGNGTTPMSRASCSR